MAASNSGIRRHRILVKQAGRKTAVVPPLQNKFYKLVIQVYYASPKHLDSLHRARLQEAAIQQHVNILA